MMNQNALAADISDNEDIGVAQATTKDDSINIKNDFLASQMAEQRIVLSACH